MTKFPFFWVPPRISIFQNETGVLDDFRGFRAFLAICSEEEGDAAFLNTDFCSASQNM